MPGDIPEKEYNNIIHRLLLRSGLSRGQVGKWMGVHGRTIDRWIMEHSVEDTFDEERKERAHRLMDLVDSLPAKTPEKRKNMLLYSATPSGVSLFHQNVKSTGQVINACGLCAVDLLLGGE